MKTKVFAVCAVVFLFCGITHAGLSDGLVAYYPFNGNASDESGNGNNGIVNGATLTEDRFGNLNRAYAFDGSTSYIDLTGKPIAQQGNNSRSVFAWCKTTDPKAYQRVVATGTAGYNQTFNILLWQNGQPGIMGYANDFYLNTVTVADGKWHFIGATHDGSMSCIWIDGVLKGSKQTTYSTTGNNNSIGRPNKGDPGAGTECSFHGSIDDVSIYNRALSESEIQQLYSSPSVIVKPYTFMSGTPAKAAEVNADFDVLYMRINALNAIVCQDHPTASICQ